MQIAQQSVDAFAQVVSTAGSIAEVAGPGAPVGMALKYTGTAIKIGAKVVFAAIDEAKVLHVKNLIKRALEGDRNAKIEIFSDSAYYAKMYVIGLAQDGAQSKRVHGQGPGLCGGRQPTPTLLPPWRRWPAWLLSGF